ILNNGFYVASVPLSDETYASKTTVATLRGSSGKVTTESNVIKMIYAANSIPKFLPLYINNFTFDGSTSSYIFADKIFIEKADPYDKSDQILFKSYADVTIESLSDVSLDLGTVFESGAKLTINAAKSVTLTKFSVPANVTLIVNAPQIYFAEDYVTLDPQATVIFNGKSMTKGRAKARSREEDYDPLVREGKIWWYGHSQVTFPITDDFKGSTIEYGLSFVGEEMVSQQQFIDGGFPCGPLRDEGPWNRIDVIKMVEMYHGYDRDLTFFDTPFPAHYLKEVDKVVKALDGVPNTRQFDRYFMHFYGISLCFDWDNRELMMHPRLYDFSDNDDDLILGDEGEYLALKFKSKERKDFFGTERLVKTFVKTELSLDEWTYDPLARVGTGSEIEITEGIGLTAIRNTRTNSKYDVNELFFSPFVRVPEVYPCGGLDWYYGSRQPMQLRYVTDMDYNIIYEGIGGVKAWELEPSGVEDVSVEGGDEVQWYTLGGISVSRPSVPGVYIRRTGNRSEKVVIR
ncbi:MAG: hypothetical protein K2M61_01160, partial [Muribaculaceae bacterium]|nr:hypothetical protein [Muribaculaceae bacterium]